MCLIISAILLNEGRDAWPEGVGIRPLLDLTELPSQMAHQISRLAKRTCPDIMIIIHLPNIKKGDIAWVRDDFIDDRFQSCCRHVVYKISEDSNVNHVVPNVFASVDSLLQRSLDS